ncbi:MAG: helix-turn-helix domain-containing protein [Actinomycetota bacterium]|nr:helix-turn-helix domain-containing protein [Actinomycetota bacterium]
MTVMDVPATISLEQAGELLGVSRRTAYRAAARGQIPTIRIGRRWFVPTARLLDLLGLSPEDVDFGRPPDEDNELVAEAS